MDDKIFKMYNFQLQELFRSQITRHLNINFSELESSVYGDNWEIPRKKLRLIRAIGEGAFGVVMEGTLDTGMDHRKQHCRNKQSMITPEARTPACN